MPPEQDTSQKEYSRLAEIYGHPTEISGRRGEINPAVLAEFDELKSGLTPTLLEPNATPEQQKRFANLEAYQRARFHGYSLQELQECQSLATAFDDSNLLSGLLDENATIHPFWARPQWKKPLFLHQAKFPIVGTDDRYWDVDDDEVWNALLPGIRLATKFVENKDIWTWWDTLVNGDVHEIERDELPRKYTKHRFRSTPQPAEQAGSEESQSFVREDFEKLEGVYRLHLFSGELTPDTGMPEGFFAIAITNEVANSGPTTYFAFETLIPLLNKNTSSAERMICHFIVANTLVHELAHALWGAFWQDEVNNDKKVCGRCSHEVYYDQEKTCELGYSLENAIFGAMTAGGLEFNQSRSDMRGLPHGGLFQSTMAKDTVHNYITVSDHPVLSGDKGEDWEEPVYWAVPLPYFYNLHIQNNWEQIRQYGSSFINIGPKIFGYRHKKSKGKKANLVRIDNPDGKLPLSKGATAAQNEATSQENNRRANGENISNALAGPSNWAQPQQEDAIMSSPTPPVPHTPGSPDTDMIDIEDISDERIEEIDEFVTTHMVALGIPSMHFSMAEHVFLRHVQRVWQKPLRSNEFRAYLKECHKQRHCFRLQITSRGVNHTLYATDKISEGWPKIDPIDRGYMAVTKKQLGIFDRLTKEALVNMLNMTNQWDHDSNEFWKYMKVWLDDINEDREVEGKDQLVFTRGVYKGCVADYEKRGLKWCFGPKGIIRKLKEGWDGQKGKGKRKRKSDDTFEDGELEPDSEERPKKRTKGEATPFGNPKGGVSKRKQDDVASESEEEEEEEEEAEERPTKRRKEEPSNKRKKGGNDSESDEREKRKRKRARSTNTSNKQGIRRSKRVSQQRESNEGEMRYRC